MNTSPTTESPEIGTAPAPATKPGTNPADPPSKPNDDTQVPDWVARAQAGDDAAFEALVRHFEKRVFGIAYRMLNHYEDAADVAQEVFVKLYTSIGQFEGRSKFSTWLFMMSVNMTRNRRRTRARLSVEKQILDVPQFDEAGSAPRDIEDPSPGPRELSGHHDIRDLVNESLSGLPEEYRDAVILRDIQFLTYEDIADTLNVSLGTVKSRIARGRAMLKDKLQKLL